MGAIFGIIIIGSNQAITHTNDGILNNGPCTLHPHLVIRRP